MKVKKGGKIFMTLAGLILLAAAALASGVFAERYFGKEEEEEKEEIYAVVFVVDGVIYDETTVKKGGEVIFPEVEPTKDGYEFAGWAYEGGALFDGAEVNATLTLVAKWTAVESYTVSFVVEGLDEPYYEITLRKDEAVRFPETDPTREGYDFAGWVYEGGTLFEGGTASGNLILTAKWTETTKLLGQLKAALKELLAIEYDKVIAANESYDQGSLEQWNEAYEDGIEAIEAA
ncbi:MAG: InlB B-repeat-containing protein, partial [Clostridiales bacterium]|nr:InlB B-repeat-containing protein [Clostridiales bacterium]